MRSDYGEGRVLSAFGVRAVYIWCKSAELFAYIRKKQYLCRRKEVLRRAHAGGGDYTQVPRGRVAWAVDHFVVFVGQWAKDIEEELTALLEKYFALPYFEFRYDEHWDLGHGWSGDL